MAPRHWDFNIAQLQLELAEHGKENQIIQDFPSMFSSIKFLYRTNIHLSNLMLAKGGCAFKQFFVFVFVNNWFGVSYFFSLWIPYSLGPY